MGTATEYTLRLMLAELEALTLPTGAATSAKQDDIVTAVEDLEAAMEGMVMKYGMLQRTGQTTQRDGELDDGYYQKGLKKTYNVLDTAQHSGTSNIDLIHLTASTISFDSAGKEIRDAGGGLKMFKTGETIVVTGDSDNNGTYTVATGNVAGVIVVNEALSDEGAGDTVNIAKREALSNNCVQDLVTGLMWARYTSKANAVMGTGGDGKMPWTGQLYDIFQWCAAANVAELGGYDDWRVANLAELCGLRDYSGSSGAPDTTTFPDWPTNWLWSSTTTPNFATYAMYVYFSTGRGGFALKTSTYYASLVRGGI